MLEVELYRLTLDLTKPQLGVLYFDAQPSLLTLELPWLNNIPGKSCIPEGTYTCRRVLNRRTLGGMDIEVTYEVTGVNGRSGILFHVGNRPEDTNGCILTGLKLGSGQDVLLNSREAFVKFLALSQGVQSFNLFISRR